MYFLVQPGKTGHDFRKETEVSLKGRVDGNVLKSRWCFVADEFVNIRRRDVARV